MKNQEVNPIAFLVLLFAGISVMLLIGLIWTGLQLEKAETLNGCAVRAD